MDDTSVRSVGGKLALWVFWSFCVYFCWTLLNGIWLLGQVNLPSGFASSSVNPVGNLPDIISGIIVLGAMGSIAWYTRPRGPDA